MRIVVLSNPVAGRGRARTFAGRIDRVMRKDDHDVVLTESTLAPEQSHLAEALAGAGGLVVVGGDGSNRIAAPHAVRAGVPIYQFPLGTENLFAREFGMDRNIDTLLRAFRTNRPVTVDAGVVNGETFLLMVSIGLDAEVVHDLVSGRDGSISHFSYIRPILAQFARWRAPRLSIEADGRQVISQQRGMVIVANCRQYGFRFDPAPCADMRDGLLDVVFFEVNSRRDLLALAWKCRRGIHLDDPRVTSTKARAVRVTSDRPQRYQIDGDAALCSLPDDSTATALTPLEISVRPGVLKVMAPGDAIGPDRH